MPNINESVRTGATLAPDPFAGILKGLEDIRKKKEAVDFEMEKGAINLKYFLQELQAKTAAEKDVEGFKADRQAEATQRQSAGNLDFLKSLGASSGSGITPGTKATINNKGEMSFNVPLNREFTSEEQTKIASSEIVSKSLDRAMNLVKDLRGGKKNGPFFGDLLVDTGNSLFTSGKREELLSEINNLKSIIPFAKGGKQLTINESKRLEKLLNITGKDTSTILRDLGRFKEEFENIRKLAVEGEAGISSQPNDFSSMSDEELKKILEE